MPLDRHSKAYAELVHSLRRASERYKQFDPGWLVRTLRRLIQGGATYCIHRASKRVTYHVAVIDGWAVLCVYDKERKQVVTLLPAQNIWSYTATKRIPAQVLRELEQARYEVLS